mmetsp:Transcript_5355/g.33561  ORF Transcript_5355/g.33561 Transcript_5355/m.33561 type:complete len:170 (+) Transcript_5355:2-511(+)
MKRTTVGSDVVLCCSSKVVGSRGSHEGGAWKPSIRGRRGAACRKESDGRESVLRFHQQWKLRALDGTATRPTTGRTAQRCPKLWTDGNAHAHGGVRRIRKQKVEDGSAADNRGTREQSIRTSRGWQLDERRGKLSFHRIVGVEDGSIVPLPEPEETSLARSRLIPRFLG